MKKNIYILIGIVVLVVIIVAITNSNKSEGSSIHALGVISPLSGPAASIGEGIKRTIDLSLASTSVEALYEDDQCDGKKAISAYQNLRLKSVNIFYVSCSGSVLALAPIAKADGTLILTGYAGSSEIRKTGTEVIRFIPDALSIVDAMVEYAESHPEQKYAILFENQDYAKSVADTLSEKLGDRIIAKESYLPAEQTFLTHITKLKASSADAIVLVPVSDVSAKVILQEMSQLKVTKPILGDVNLCDYPFSPKDFGLHGTCWKAKLSSAGFDAFISKFKDTYGVDSQYQFYDAVTYDIGKILVDEAGKIKAKTPADLITALKADILKGVTGPVTSYTFEPNGEVIGGKYLVQIDF